MMLSMRMPRLLSYMNDSTWDSISVKPVEKVALRQAEIGRAKLGGTWHLTPASPRALEGAPNGFLRGARTTATGATGVIPTGKAPRRQPPTQSREVQRGLCLPPGNNVRVFCLGGPKWGGGTLVPLLRNEGNFWDEVPCC